MLMANSLLRFLFKWKYVIIVILTIGAGMLAFCVRINHWLPDFASSYSQVLAQQFQTKITFKTVRYRFPYSIVFEDLTIIRKDNAKVVSFIGIVWISWWIISSTDTYSSDCEVFNIFRINTLWSNTNPLLSAIQKRMQKLTATDLTIESRKKSQLRVKC